ncbi:MAG: hypothetical protein AB7L84_09425 [Acidimicrobiia bacterium]
MPTDQTSRYRHEAPHHAPDSSGTPRAAVPARWGTGGPTAIVYHTIAAGETFEVLAHRHLGSSALWWRIADANPRLFPLALTPGTVVAIPTGNAVAGPPRTRSW